MRICRVHQCVVHRSDGRAGWPEGIAIIVVAKHLRKTQRLQLAQQKWSVLRCRSIRARDDERIVQNADLTAQPDETEIVSGTGLRHSPQNSLLWLSFVSIAVICSP